MEGMEKIKSNLQDLEKSLSKRDVFLFISVVVFSSIASFAVFNTGSSTVENPEQSFNEELNNTHNSAVLDFFN